MDFLLADAIATNYLLHGSLVCIDFLHKFLFNFLNKRYHFEAVNTNWWQPSMAKQPNISSYPEIELPPPVPPLSPLSKSNNDTTRPMITLLW